MAPELDEEMIGLAQRGLASDPRVLRVLALSGGYSRDEADELRIIGRVGMVLQSI